MRADVEEKSAETHKHAPEETGNWLWREIVSWFWVILVFLVIEGALVEARVIPSGSMERTVLVGDHLIVSRIGYDAGIPFTNWHIPLWRNPKRQQIIVFRAPLPEQGYPDFIKRTIGVPGRSHQDRRRESFREWNGARRAIRAARSDSVDFNPDAR